MEDDNPYRSPETDAGPDQHEQAEPRAGLRRAKRKVLAAILVLFALCGLLTPLVSDGSASDKGMNLVTGLALAVLLLQWCSYDRLERGIKRWPFFAVMMVLCPGPLIVMPIYLLATRGLRGVLSILMAAGFLVLMIVALLAGLAVSLTATGGWESFLE